MEVAAPVFSLIIHFQTRMVVQANQDLASDRKDDSDFLGAAVNHEAKVACHFRSSKHLVNTDAYEADSLFVFSSAGLTPEVRRRYLASCYGHYGATRDEVG